MISSQHTIGTSRSKVISESDSARTVYLHVVGNGTVYIGGDDVTTANGLHTKKHTLPFTVFIPAHDELWAVVAADTEDLRILMSETKSGNV